MTITIGLGWWLLPAAVTVAAFVWRWWLHKGEPRTYGGYSGIGDGIGRLLSLFAALTAALFAWLIWALLR